MQETTDFQPEETHLFSESETKQLEYATRNQRFLNFVVDNIFMQFGLAYATEILLGILLQSLSPEFLSRIAYEENSLDILLFSYLVGTLNYLLYYTICEKAFKGYTLGKLLTGSRAIRVDGGELTFKDAFLRSLSRLVPFEAFSGFGTPWHDTWTKTTVIKSR